MAINRSALTRKSALQVLEKLQDATTKKSYKDDRFWTLKQVAGSKNAGQNAAAAVIRFLPAKTEEGLPYVKLTITVSNTKASGSLKTARPQSATAAPSAKTCRNCSTVATKKTAVSGRKSKSTSPTFWL